MNFDDEKEIIYKILIIEDDFITAISMQKLLEKYHYKVLGIVSNLADAEKHIAENPDLLITDINLGSGSDGIELAMKIKLLSDIPVVFVTAYSDDATIQRAKLISPYGFLIKPFDSRELYSTVEMAINKHKIEAKVRRSEEKYKNIFENIQDAYYETSLDGIILEVSPGIKALSNGTYCREDLIGKSINEFYVNSKTRNDLLALLMSDGSFTDYEVDFINRDSTLINCSISSKLLRNIDGTPYKIVGSLRNIAQRKLVENQLKESRRNYKALFEDSPIPMMEQDYSGIYNHYCKLKDAGIIDFRKYLADNPDQVGYLASLPKITAINNSALRTLKIKGNTLTQAELLKMFNSNSYNTYKDGLINIYDGAYEYKNELELINAEGERLILDLSLKIQPGYENTFEHVILSINDISERKINEKITIARYRLIELSSTCTSAELLTATLDEIEKITESSNGYYHIINDEQKFSSVESLSTIALNNNSPIEVKNWQDNVEIARTLADCINEKQPVIINDLEKISDRNRKSEVQAKAIREAVVPLFRDKKVVAVIGVGNKKTHYDERDIEMIRLLGDLSWDIVERKIAEENLARERKLLETIVNNLPIALYVKDTEGRKLITNPKDIENLGGTKASILGKNDYSVLPEELAGLTYADDMKVIKNGESIINKEELLTINDKNQWLLTTKIPQRNSKGEIIGLVGMGIDITEKKLAENEIVAQKNLLSSIFETAPYIFILVNEAGRVLAINKAGEIFANQKKEDIIGLLGGDVFRCMNSLIAPGCGKGEACKSCLIRTNVNSTFATGDSKLNIEGQMEFIINEEPVILDLMVSTNKVIQKGENLVLVTIVDITEKKEADRLLKESEERLRQIAEGINEVFWLRNENNTELLYLSPGYEKIWGRTVQSAFEVPYSFLESIYKDDVLKVKRGIENYFKTGKVDIEYRILKPTGELVWVHSKSFPILNQDGKVIRNAGIATDITERKKAEIELAAYRNHLEDLVESRTKEIEEINKKLVLEIEREKEIEIMLKEALENEKQMNELKTRFISTASHEFRTPLTTVLSSVELIQRYGKNWDLEKQTKHIDRIKESIDHLTKLLDDVLTISRAESGNLKNNPVKVDLDELCRKFIEDVKGNASQAHNIKYKYRASEKEFNLDPKLLRFIFTNLLTNAIKYSPGGGKIGFEFSISGSNLHFVVSDEGIGIAPEDEKHLFEPFYRAGNAADIEGTGLGLSIVKRALDIQGGTIKYKSDLGKGTFVEINIPRV